MKQSIKDFFYFNKGVLISIVLTAIFLAFDLGFSLVSNKYLSDISGVLTGIDGALIGFHISGIAIFYAINFSERIQKNIEIARYDIIVPRSFFLSIITFLFAVILFFFSFNAICLKINFYLTICGLIQTFFCGRLLYILGIKRKG